MLLEFLLMLSVFEKFKQFNFWIIAGTLSL